MAKKGKVKTKDKSSLIEDTNRGIQQEIEPDASLADYVNSDSRYDDIDAQFRVVMAKENS